jgi:hypothetical protein
VGDPLNVLLLLCGGGFLFAILLIMADVWRFRQRRPMALLTWLPPRPKPAILSRLIAVGLAAVLFYKLVILRWPVAAVFGEGMMFLYFAIWYPLSFTVAKGFYEHGVWLERRFVKYGDITGITWREDPNPTLLVVVGHKQMASHVAVPLEFYAEARKILRDRINADQLHMGKPLLDLGGHDRREDV